MATLKFLCSPFLLSSSTISPLFGSFSASIIPQVVAVQAEGRKLIWPQRFLSCPWEEEKGVCAQLAYLSLVQLCLAAMEDGKLQSSISKFHLIGFWQHKVPCKADNKSEDLSVLSKFVFSQTFVLVEHNSFNIATMWQFVHFNQVKAKHCKYVYVLCIRA